MPSVLEDKDAIRDVLARYCFHFDLGEFEEWLQLFTEDGVFEVHGMGRFVGRNQLRAFLGAIPLVDGLPMLKHCAMNEIIVVDGDRAEVRSYVLVVGGESEVRVGVAGRYEDQLRRANGAWRFAERRAHLDLMNRP